MVCGERGAGRKNVYRSAYDVASFIGLHVSLCSMLMGKLAVFQSRCCVLLGLFVLTERVMMLRLMVVMRGGMVVTGRPVMMLTRWMFRSLCHLDALSNACPVCLSGVTTSDIARHGSCVYVTGVSGVQLRVCGPRILFNSFTCPNCQALYQFVKVEAGPETNDRELKCRSCGGPLASREEKLSRFLP